MYLNQNKVEKSRNCSSDINNFQRYFGSIMNDVVQMRSGSKSFLRFVYSYNKDLDLCAA